MLFLRTRARPGRSNESSLPTATSSSQPSLEAQTATGTDEKLLKSASTYGHRDGLGRVTQLANDDWTRYGWYLDPESAKLVELPLIQGTENMHSKLPWVIQTVAASYKSDGKGVLRVRPFHYVYACLALPVYVSHA
jgi:hypothetical protein